MGEKRKGGVLIKIFKNVLSAAENYIWPIAITLFIILLAAGYQFIIKPQYQSFIATREDIRIQQLEQDKSNISSYIKEVENFIEQEKNITDAERNKIETIFVTLEENLILQQQLEKLFTNEHATISSIDISPSIEEGDEVDLTKEEGDEVENDEAEFNIFDLLDGGADDDIIVSAAEASSEIVLKVLPIHINFNSPTYYDAKEMISILENTIPIIDIETLEIIQETDRTAVEIFVSIIFEKQNT